jgi:hypothetical protein
MWITKVDFIGLDSNRTITIDTSTTKQYAEGKYDRELNKWLKRLTALDIAPFVTLDMVYDRQVQNTFKLDLIDLCLSVLNKNCSFKIEIYESLEPL